MGVRCKMRLVESTDQVYGGKRLKFSAEYDSALCAEDAAFQTATPQATFETLIDNPKALEQLKLGDYYYVDFSPVG